MTSQPPPTTALWSVGIEADEAYCEVIAQRLSQGTLDFDAPTPTQLLAHLDGEPTHDRERQETHG